jgi:YNFM family putative membrane transporter
VSSSLNRPIVLLAMAAFCSLTVQRMCDPMLPELAREFDSRLSDVAVVISWFAVTYGLMQIIYGPLADRIGKFRVVSYTTLGCSLGCLACALAPSLGWLTLARILAAATAAAIVPVSLAWIGDQVPYQSRQETLARVSLGSTLGLLAGQFMGGLFTDTVGWRWGFVFVGALFMVSGGLLWLSPHTRTRPAHTSTGPSPVPKAPAYRQALDVLGQVRPRWILLTVLVEGCTVFGAVALTATHLQSSLQLSLSRSSAIAALFGAGGVLYMVLARHLIRRLGAYGLTRLGGVLFGVSFLILAYCGRWEWAIPASVLSGVGFSMFHNTMQAHATEMAPSVRGICMSLFAGTLFAGQSLGVLIATHMIEWVGMEGVMALAGLILLMLGFIFPTLMRRWPSPH